MRLASAAPGELDAIVFSAGTGEHCAPVIATDEERVIARHTGAVPAGA